MQTIRQLLQEISDDIRSETGNVQAQRAVADVIEILDKRGKASLLVTTERELLVRAGYAP